MGTHSTPVQIKWPNALVIRLRALADSRHTTVSELTRQAVIAQYSLESTPDTSPETGPPPKRK